MINTIKNNRAFGLIKNMATVKSKAVSSASTATLNISQCEVDYLLNGTPKKMNYQFDGQKNDFDIHKFKASTALLMKCDKSDIIFLAKSPVVKLNINTNDTFTKVMLMIADKMQSIATINLPSNKTDTGAKQEFKTSLDREFFFFENHALLMAFVETVAKQEGTTQLKWLDAITYKGMPKSEKLAEVQRGIIDNKATPYHVELIDGFVSHIVLMALSE